MPCSTPAGLWIAEGAHGRGGVIECFVLRETGRDANGNIVYEGGSIDGMRAPGDFLDDDSFVESATATKRDEGCFSLMDCSVIDDGELTFRQQFHDGDHATVWRARLSHDGSELQDGRWTDAVHSAAEGHFTAKRIRSPAVESVEIEVTVEEVSYRGEQGQEEEEALDHDQEVRILY